jgi:hypothetical protein
VNDSKFSKTMSQQNLLQNLSEYSKQARDTRQVSRRLKRLLPNRLKELQQQQGEAPRRKGAQLRQVMAGPEYSAIIDEMTEIYGDSLQYRILYETHMMLFEARRSLRAFRSQRE